MALAVGERNVSHEFIVQLGFNSSISQELDFILEFSNSAAPALVSFDVLDCFNDVPLVDTIILGTGLIVECDFSSS